MSPILVNYKKKTLVFSYRVNACNKILKTKEKKCCKSCAEGQEDS
jgi:rRNA maturation endonuclease Nob1